MSNEIKTRRLIVTLPANTGEEADIIAASIADLLLDYRADLAASEVYTVTHALGESLPVGMTCFVTDGGSILIRDAGQKAVQRLALNVRDARQLAGVLLAHADDVEGLS